MIESEVEAKAFVARFADREAMERLAALREALIDENGRQNLVSSGSLAAIWQRHFADSTQLVCHVSRETGIWLDLGTGAGFPGLVIAALRPHRETVLVESRRKRIDWLNDMIAKLGLPKCRVEGQRLEAVESFGAAVISARAFAPLPRLVQLSARFSTSRTRWVLPKGRSAAQEVRELPEWQRKMFHVEQSLTDSEAGIIVGTGRLEAKP